MSNTVTIGIPSWLPTIGVFLGSDGRYYEVCRLDWKTSDGRMFPFSAGDGKWVATARLLDSRNNWASFDVVVDVEGAP